MHVTAQSSHLVTDFTFAPANHLKGLIKAQKEQSWFIQLRDPGGVPTFAFVWVGQATSNNEWCLCMFGSCMLLVESIHMK